MLTLKVTKFLARQFAKAEINQESDYLISALFSEIVINKGFDGILYPSVRVGGKGFNVAIKPESADKKLKLAVAGECTLYKNKDIMALDNNTICEIKEGVDELSLVEVEEKYKEGEPNCLKAINVSSIEELNSNSQAE